MHFQKSWFPFLQHPFFKACQLGRYPGVEVELQEIKQCVEEGDSKKISFWQAIQERTFRIPMATFATIFLLLGICGNDTMVFYGPTIAAQVKNCDQLTF